MRVMLLFLTFALSACSTNPSMKDLNCDPGWGSCGASIEQQGYDWYVQSETECGLVTLDNGKKLPFCGYQRRLGQGNFGITSCQACVRRER